MVFFISSSRTVAADQREQLLHLENKLVEVRDDSAKQVLAFREQADVLADETRTSEEAAIQLRGQLRKTKGLLTDAVRTIEHLKDELQNDDAKRSSEEKHTTQSIRQLEQRLTDTTMALKSTEARYKLQQQESKRVGDAKDRLSKELKHAHHELETLRKQYDETRRNLLHLQRCARNAQVIEKNAARFLRDTTTNKSSSTSNNNSDTEALSGSTSARGKLNGNGNGSRSNGLPNIGSPRVTTEMSTSRAKRKSKSTSKLGSRPGSAPLRRRDQNK
jgi:chromosome segregation ATPase